MIWAEYDLKQMVKRGKNSPAIIMWSLGNEIAETDSGRKKSLEMMQNLHNWVNEIDKTGKDGHLGNFRFTTIGENGYAFNSSGHFDKTSEVVDAVGLNDAEYFYDTIKKKFI